MRTAFQGVLFLALLTLTGCGGTDAVVTEPPESGVAMEVAAEPDARLVSDRVPAWAHEAVFYQLFPERFRNADPTNDPTRASLETPVSPRVPDDWQVTPWTSDWYERADWEEARGDDFYEDGVFDRRYGGDLQGVIEKLDYLRALGINVIYFNPVFYGRSLHKYDGNSFHHIDPFFGPDPEGDLELMEQETADPASWHVTAADSLFYVLLDEAHRRDIRIVIDGVFNHTGRDFFAFADLKANQEDSPYADWYVVHSFDDPATPDTSEFDYEGWWGVETLPEFANNAAGDDLHPGPKQYVMDATARWMDPDGDGDPSDGIDGWRLDVAEEVPVGFWADWNEHVRDLNPQAYTVSEIWGAAEEFIAEGGFSATMNYHGFAFPVKGFLIDSELAPSDFAEMIDERRTDLPVPVRYAVQNLVDSHDTPRLASMIVNRDTYSSYAQADRFDYDWGDRVSPRGGGEMARRYEVGAPSETGRDIQRLVALFQMSYVGAPMIYYGTEAGMWGADDPDDRKPMVWPDLEYDDETNDPLGREREPDPVAFDEELHHFYQEAIALRHDHPALQEGSFEVLLADDEREIFVFARQSDDDTVVIALNRSGEAHSVRVELPAHLRLDYETALTTKETYRVQQDATALLLELSEYGGLALTN